MKRTHLDLFSGIGGFALAAEWAGFTTVQFCEIDPFCRQVLGKHWPHVPIHDDIRTLTADVVGQPVELLTGGFPCQPFSVAGKQLGAADDRHLWPEMARVIDECRPRWVLGENTPGIIGMALDDCLADLESIGYEAWTVVIPACGVGAWHQRQRVWIVAHTEKHAGELLTSERESVRNIASVDGETRNLRRSDRTTPEVIGEQPNGSVRSDARERVTDDADLFRHFPQDDTVRAGRHAFVSPDRWNPESGVCRVPDGVSTGVDRRIARLKSLGNAIVPQVAYEIIRHMAVMS